MCSLHVVTMQTLNLIIFCFKIIAVVARNNFYYNGDENDKPSPIQINFGHFQFVISKNNLSAPECRRTRFARLVNGRNAFADTYPFAALLFRQGKPYGGAAIIAREWLLTAAHNFHASIQVNDYSIGVGSIYLDQLHLHDIAKILIHPSYVRKQKFDIALLKLVEPLDFGNPNIRPICLPEYSFEPINADKARVVGWGYPNFQTREVSPVLKEVDLEIIPLDRCRQMYAPLNQDIIRSQICTWTRRKDACSVSLIIFT